MSALKAPPTLGLRSVAGFAADLRQALASSGPLTLDLSELTDCDALGFQLIEAARTEAEAAGQTLHLQPPPDGPVQAMLRRLGASPDSHPHWFAEAAA